MRCLMDTASACFFLGIVKFRRRCVDLSAKCVPENRVLPYPASPVDGTPVPAGGCVCVCVCVCVIGKDKRVRRGGGCC